MSDWTEAVWEWLKSVLEQEENYAYTSLPETPDEAASRRDVNTTASNAAAPAIYSVVSLSQWLPAAFESAVVPDKLTPFEVEHTERSAFESFLQGYSLL